MSEIPAGETVAWLRARAHAAGASDLPNVAEHLTRAADLIARAYLLPPLTLSLPTYTPGTDPQPARLPGGTH